MTHPKDNAGYKIARRTGPGRSWVTVYHAHEAQLDEEGGPLAVVCEEHGAVVNVDTRVAAESVMRAGSVEFCDECRAMVSEKVGFADDVSIGEQAARWRKIAHLLAALYKHQIPTKRVAQLGKNQLRIVAKAAGVHPPSDTTMKLLRDTLRKIPPPKS